MPVPTAVISSGNGVHLYWVLDERFVIDDVGDPPAVHTEFVESGDDGKRQPRKYILEGNERLYLDVPQNRPQLSEKAVYLQDVLAGIADAIGGDHTTDVSRLLRVPGTLNRKNERNGTEPKKCRLIALDAARRYEIGQFDSFVNRSPARIRRVKVASVKLPKTRKTIPRGIEDKFSAHVLDCALEENDRSAADFALCCFAIRKGIDQERVWSEVAGISKFAQRGRPYFDLTWDNAARKTREDIFDTAVERRRRESIAAVVDGNGDDVDLDKLFDRDGVAKTLAAVIRETEYFARDDGGKLYHYSGGVYRQRAEWFVKQRVIKILEKGDLTKYWSDHAASEVVRYILQSSPELWSSPPLDILNLKNGLLRLDGRKLLPHTPDHLTDIQLPVAYDPQATCPHTDAFDAQVFPIDCLDLAREMLAWLMVPDTSIQKAVLLIGDGGNGKSRKLAQLSTFLGKSNISSLSLHRLESDKFGVAQLRGKLANICPDLPSTDLIGTSTFKAILGGDDLQGEYKFKDSFSFRPFARLIFSANHPPRSGDGSAGFFDRWLVVPFEGRFRGTDEEIPQTVLDERLAAPQELSGLLNHALDALDHVRTAGLSEPLSVQRAGEEFRAATDPLAVWLDRYTVDDSQGFVESNVLRLAFAAECERRGLPAMTKTAFGLSFKKLRPQSALVRRTKIDGSRVWAYQGIDLLHEAVVGTVEIEGKNGGDDKFEDF